MPVRQHAGHWEARVQHAGRRISRTFKNRRDALEFERRYRSRVEDSRVGRTPAYSLEEALERWLKGEAAGLKSYGHLVKQLRTVYPFVKGRALTEVVEVAEELKADARKRESSPSTINRKLATLRRVARLAHRQWGWLTEALGDRINLVPGEKQRHVYLDPPAVQKLLRACRGRVRDAVLLAVLTGLRRAEILRLTTADRRNGALVLGETKNGRPRIVPLPKEAAAIRLPIGLSEGMLRKGFEEARAKAGLPGVRFHDLRHTYASWLVQAGSGLTVVRDLLGHSSLAVTSRYSHLSDRHLRQAVRKLPSVGMARGRKKAA